MLAAAVHSRKGFFVKQTHKSVLLCDVLKDFHGKLVMIGSYIRGGKDRCKLMLRRRHLIVFGLGKDAQLPKLFVDIIHEGGDARLYRAEIVVVEFLAFGRFCAEKSASGINKILTLIKHFLCNKEVFLFGSYSGLYGSDVGISEQTENAKRLLVDSFHRAEQRSFFVKRFSAVRTEGSGNT